MENFQTILDSATDVISHRKFLTLKIFCVESSHSKKVYLECIQNIDDTLNMIFDAKCKQLDIAGDARLDILLEFWQAIDAMM
jgi:hypothetical protein